MSDYTRAALERHLSEHPDHARASRTYNFPGRWTAAGLLAEHERQHGNLPLRASHRHEVTALRVPGEDHVSNRESTALDLKVTVSCTSGDPDAVLARMDKDSLRLTASPYTLKVTRVERADGQQIGLEAAFGEFWREACCEGDDGDPDVRDRAHDGFMYGVKYGREQK